MRGLLLALGCQVAQDVVEDSAVVVVRQLARGVDAFDAACAGVYLHGFAADILRDEMGDTGLAANDLAEKLAFAIQRLQRL